MSLLNLDRFIPKSSIKVAYYDKDGTLVEGATQDQALGVEKLRPGTNFYYRNDNGSVSELGINQVINLKTKNLLPQGPPCPTSPQVCGPPKVKIFGGNGIGAIANAIISPNSSSIIGFDIVNPGRGFLSPPYVELVDECGKGSGAAVRAIIGPLDGRNGNPTILNPVTGQPETGLVNVVVDAPGDGYINAPDGSLGGNEQVWAEPTDGYIINPDGVFVIIPGGEDPPEITLDDPTIYVPPRIDPSIDPSIDPPTDPQKFPRNSQQYPVILEIDDVVISNPGFGYEPGDTIKVTPDNGAVLEPIIDGNSVIGVKVVKPGIGFNDLPNIEVISDAGYNAEFKPVLKVVDPETIDEIPSDVQIIQVIDCVGKV